MASKADTSDNAECASTSEPTRKEFRKILKARFLKAHSCWKWLLRRLAYMLPLMILLGIGLIGAALVMDEPWPYLIDASAGRIEILPGGSSPTFIPLEGAALCVRRTTAGDLPLREGSDLCTGGWVEAGLVLDSNSALEISERSSGSKLLVAHYRDGSFRMEVSPGEDQKLKLIGPVPREIGTKVVVVFPPQSGGAFARTVIVPFQGGFSVGTEIDTQGLARDDLLRSGMISVFGYSDDNASGRRALDEFQLLTGDRVDAGAIHAEVTARANGYLEMRLVEPSSDQVPPGVRLVATGFVEGLSVKRHGSATIDLEPSAWAKLVRHPIITLGLALLTGLIGLMAVYREASELGLPHD